MAIEAVVLIVMGMSLAFCFGRRGATSTDARETQSLPLAEAASRTRSRVLDVGRCFEDVEECVVLVRRRSRTEIDCEEK